MKHVSKRPRIIAMFKAGKSLGEIARKLKMGKGNVAWYVDNYKKGNMTKQEALAEVARLRHWVDLAAVVIRDLYTEVAAACVVPPLATTHPDLTKRRLTAAEKLMDDYPAKQ